MPSVDASAAVLPVLPPRAPPLCVSLCAPATAQSGANWDARVSAGAPVRRCRRCRRPFLAAAGSCDECASRVVYNGADVPLKRWRQREVLFSQWREERADAGAAGAAPAQPTRKRKLAAGAAGAGPAVHATGPLQLDAEGWYSLTPEPVAAYIAAACCGAAGAGTVVLDLFAGCGGNAIAFARSRGCAAVIAVDACRERLVMARANAAVYAAAVSGCAHGAQAPIFFVNGDAVALLADVLDGGGGGGAQAVAGPAAALDTAAVAAAAAAGVYALAEAPAGAPALRCWPESATLQAPLTLLFAGMPDAAPVALRIGAVFAAPPWGGDAYLSAGGAAAAAGGPPPAPPPHVDIAGDLADALAARDIGDSERVRPFDMEAGLRVQSPAAARFARVLGGAGAVAGAGAGAGADHVGGSALLAGLVAAFAPRGAPVSLYLPRNCVRAEVVARLASAAGFCEAAEAGADGGARPAAAGPCLSLQDLFLDDRREATALLASLGPPLGQAAGEL